MTSPHDRLVDPEAAHPSKVGDSLVGEDNQRLDMKYLDLAGTDEQVPIDNDIHDLAAEAIRSGSLSIHYLHGKVHSIEHRRHDIGAVWRCSYDNPDRIVAAFAKYLDEGCIHHGDTTTKPIDPASILPPRDLSTGTYAALVPGACRLYWMVDGQRGTVPSESRT